VDGPEKINGIQVFPEGLTWTGSLVLHRGPAAYSDLTRLSGGNLGCLYEAGLSSPYEGISFQEIPWQQIEKASGQ